MRVIYHRHAEVEVVDAATFYSSKVPGLGADFLVEVDRAVQSIQSDPTRFEVMEDDIRRCPVKRFPYSIYFRVVVDTVRILVVQHHGRDSEYWKSRL